MSPWLADKESVSPCHPVTLSPCHACNYGNAMHCGGERDLVPRHGTGWDHRDIRNHVRTVHIENPPANSLVWGSLRSPPIKKSAATDRVWHWSLMLQTHFIFLMWQIELKYYSLTNFKPLVQNFIKSGVRHAGPHVLQCIRYLWIC